MDINAFNRMLLHSVLLLLLLLTQYKTKASLDDNTHNVAKRLDSDVCSENFNIHSSTIIRTEESKAMGARFIDDEEVASSEACMKLCCSTNDCDVFIFEEKTLGTCFLFHCGQPDDFRCKFTAHTNYSSGILTVTRTELQQALANQASKPKLSQNELELANLKRPAPAYHSPSSSNSEVGAAVTTSTIPPLGVRLADITSTQAAIKSSTCGRFQFQCQTSKECIAIYNVCDQIAQCEDGSDEGPECPAATPSQAKNNVNGIENQPKMDNQISRNRMIPANLNDNFNSQMQRTMIHNREDPMSAPKYPQNHIGNYMETDDSRIFTHKNGLLSSTNVNNYPAIQYQQPQQTNKYPYMMPQQPPQQSIEEQIYQQRNDWPQMPQQQQPAPQVVIQQIPSTAKQQSNSVWPEKLPKQIDEKIATHGSKKEQQKDLEYSEEYGEGEESQAEGDDVTTTEAPKKKQRKHKKIKNKDQTKSHEKPLHEQLKQLKIEANEDAKFIQKHGGHSEKPTGAILSLTIGCLILACLSVLVGCRMRRVTVRRRRHGSKAVDADFLVNGMYL